MELSTYKLILGSKSPRRSELLTKAGFRYEQRVIETDESFPPKLELNLVAEHIAVAKANAHEGQISKGELLVTADTIVVYNNKVYGKPISADAAVQTLLLLSDQVHIVYSGVCLRSIDKSLSFTEKSEVKFGKITEQEAITYVSDFNPLDKAGSYGIQDWIGFARIEWIHGSYTNILGLPLAQTYDAILNF